MELEQKKKDNMALMIFLVAIFVLFSVLIFTLGSRIFTESKNATDTRTPQMIGCVGLSFSLSYIEYKNNELSFEIKNLATSDREITKLVLLSGKNKREINLGPLDVGDEKEMTIPDFGIVNNSFKAYPDDCGIYSNEYISEDEINFEKR